MRLVWIIAVGLLVTGAKPKAPEKKGSLEKADFKEILERYQFIADFREKPAERPVSGEVFWRYPFKIPPQTFDLVLDKGQMDKMVFRVPGDGRMAEHFAKGRVEFLEGKYDQAHATWLAGRQMFDKDPLMNKRFEFFMAINALQRTRELLAAAKGDTKDPTFLKMAQRARYFLASAFILRRDVADPEIDKHVAWGLYNLSVIYFIEGRWSYVAGATQEGLGHLLALGAKDYRPKFRQMLAEVYVQNQDLLPAIQELDTAIRQDPDPVEAARMFYRIGDMYYGLNNFELADDIYRLGYRLDETRTEFNPGQAVLRAEAMFWLGQFDNARKLMTVALNSAVARDKDWVVASGALPWVRLRIADANLALLEKAVAKDRKKLAEETRLAYFRVESEHPTSEAARVARVRGACMELPIYEGNNVKHARELLEDVETKKDIPEVLMELVTACHVGSYSDRERTPEMVAKVKAFAEKYPNSKFLDRMLPAVREVQATNIEPYFAKGDDFAATQFFEAKRKALYPKVSDDLSRKLFNAYVDTSRADQAKEFWPKAKGFDKTDEAFLRELTFLTEASRKSKSDKNLDRDLAEAMMAANKRTWAATLTKGGREYLARILNGPKSKEQLLWILRAVEGWSAKDSDQVCSVTYPMIARIFEQRKDDAAQKVVKDHVVSVLPKLWDELTKKEGQCAQSWLDLEAQVFSLQEKQKLYQERTAWKLEGPWLERLWVHSEELERHDRTTEARAIWERVAKEGPADSFEVRMAKTRLDTQSTEFESLWK